MKTAKDISEMLSARAEEVALFLLPGGKKMGPEWCAGSVGGEAGSSLKVHLTGSKAGVWADFSNDGKGDLLDLWKAVKGVSFVAALKEAKTWLGISDADWIRKPNPQNAAKSFLKPKLEGVAMLVPNGSPFEYLTVLRGVSRAILERYKVREFTHPEHGPACVFPIFAPNEAKYPDLLKYLAVKRAPNGKKVIWASKDAKPHLFGWQAMTTDSREIVITEGEIDALTVADWGFPALSVHSGTQNMDWIDQDFDELARFSKIYILTDNDEPGNKCAEVIASRLGRERCYRVKLGEFKDANEAHMSGKFIGPDFMDALEKARTLDPEELRNASEYGDSVWEEFNPSPDKIGTPTPWSMDWRVRTGEITLITGWSGHGKSHCLTNLILNDLSQGNRSLIASLEMTPQESLSKMVRMALGHVPNSRQESDAALKWMSPCLWMYDVVGSRQWREMIPQFEYAIKRYGITRIVVDSLLKCRVREDDHDEQKDFVQALFDLTRKAGVHIFLVAHSRKDEDESKPPGKMDIRGSASITDQVDNGFTFWRNKSKEEVMAKAKLSGTVPDHKIVNASDAVIKFWKNRKRGVEPYVQVWLNHSSGQFVDNSNAVSKKYMIA